MSPRHSEHIVRRTGAMILLIAALAAGCQSGGPRPPAAEQSALAGRARDLLLRACESDLDVVRTHAIEAVARELPDEMAVIRPSLSSASPMVRFAACAALGELRDRASAAAFAQLLNDPDPRVRLAAAFGAVRTGDAGRAALLAEVLGTHPDENLRCDAAYLIGRLGDARALKRLRLLARRERSTRVLMHIYTATATLGDESGLDRLMEAVVSSDIVARLIALQSLAELGAERSRDALTYRFQQDGDYVQTRLIAARGLGKLRSSVGYDLAMSSLNHQDADANEQMRVRSLAALALGAIGDVRALPALGALAEQESDARVQVAACLAICEIVR